MEVWRMRKWIRRLMHVMFAIMLFIIFNVLYMVGTRDHVDGQHCFELYAVTSIAILLIIGKIWNVLEKRELKRREDERLCGKPECDKCEGCYHLWEKKENGEEVTEDDKKTIVPKK